MPIWLDCGNPPCYFISAIRLTQDELSVYSGWNLTKVKVYIEDIWPPEATFIIYGEGTSTQPGSIIYEDNDVYLEDDGYNIIELKISIPLDEHDELWVAIAWEYDITPPIGLDDGPAVPLKGDWVSQTGVSWEELRDGGLDNNWPIGAIVEGEGTELSIINITGPIGVNAEVKNIGEVPAYNVKYTMIVTGGILGRIFRIVSDSVTELAPDETIPIYSDLIFGFGPITIDIKANSSNAYEVTKLKNAFIIGPFVFGIR